MWRALSERLHDGRGHLRIDRDHLNASPGLCAVIGVVARHRELQVLADVRALVGVHQPEQVANFMRRAGLKVEALPAWEEDLGVEEDWRDEQEAAYRHAARGARPR